MRQISRLDIAGHVCFGFGFGHRRQIDQSNGGSNRIVVFPHIKAKKTFHFLCDQMWPDVFLGRGWKRTFTTRPSAGFIG